MAFHLIAKGALLALSLLVPAGQAAATTVSFFGMQQAEVTECEYTAGRTDCDDLGSFVDVVIAGTVSVNDSLVDQNNVPLVEGMNLVLFDTNGVGRPMVGFRANYRAPTAVGEVGTVEVSDYGATGTLQDGVFFVGFGMIAYDHNEFLSFEASLLGGTVIAATNAVFALVAVPLPATGFLPLCGLAALPLLLRRQRGVTPKTSSLQVERNISQS